MPKRKKFDIKKIDTIDSRDNDIIRVTDFRVTPVNPKKGKQVTVRMTIKNVSAKTLKSVPWQIVLNDKILDHGARCMLSPGDSFKISVTWTAAPGKHFFYGDADPFNTLKEPKIKQFNNLPQGIDVKVN
jgi:hypothetical protein